ncbi:MAG: DUF6010 family protein [Acidimicrobiales bacterium]
MLTEIGRDGRAELHLSGPVGAAVGFGLAVVLLAPLLFLSKLAGMQFLAVQLSFIGAVYFGFGVADGRITGLAVEFLVAGAFLFAAAAALWADAPIVLAIGYAAHAAWDLAHHPRTALMPVRPWYPPFCVVYDLVCAVFVLAWLPLGGVA